MSDENVLQLISNVDEFLQMHKEFDDKDLDFALSKIIHIILKPDIPAQSLVTLIIQLQAIASKLHVIASYMKNVAKPSPGSLDFKRKNMYYSIADALNDLVAALKYGVRN